MSAVASNSKYFSSDAVYHKILRDQQLRYGPDEQWRRLKTGRLKTGWAQKVVIGGTKCSWKPVTGIVPQGSVLGLILFRSGWWGRVYPLQVCWWHHTGGVADAPDGHAVIQKDLERLEKWAYGNFMRLNKEKCKVLHLGRNSPRHQYTLEATCREGPACPGGHQVGHEPAMGPCCKRG